MRHTAAAFALLDGDFAITKTACENKENQGTALGTCPE
jgi:hypothetical protein